MGVLELFFVITSDSARNLACVHRRDPETGVLPRDSFNSCCEVMAVDSIAIEPYPVTLALSNM